MSLVATNHIIGDQKYETFGHIPTIDIGKSEFLHMILHLSKLSKINCHEQILNGRF